MEGIDTVFAEKIPDAELYFEYMDTKRIKTGAYYESLSLAVARTVMGVEQVTPGFPTDTLGSKSYTGMEWLQVGDTRIPVDQNVRALIPFRGRQGSFPYVSATDSTGHEA